MNATSLQLMWNELNCSERNSIISRYRVAYMEESKPDGKHVDVGDLRVTITGLTPSTNYTVFIAALNEEQELGPLYNLTLTTSSLAEKDG